MLAARSCDRQVGSDLGVVKCDRQFESSWIGLVIGTFVARAADWTVQASARCGL